MFFIDIKGNGKEDTQRVQAGTALETGARELPHAPLHFVLLHKVLRRFWNVQESIDSAFGNRRPRGCQIGFILSELIRRGHGVN